MAHRISGSFHWEVPLRKIIIGEKDFRPSSLQAFLDTGASGFFIYYRDAAKLIKMICSYIDEHVSPDFVETPKCEATYGYSYVS